MRRSPAASFALFFVAACARPVPPALSARPVPSTAPVALGPRCEKVAACDVECDAGRAASCARLGELYESAVPQRLARALRAYDAGCRLYDRAACDASSRLRQAERSKDLARNEAAKLCSEGSVRECGNACDAGNAWACESYGYLLVTGTRVKQDRAKAEVAFQRACERDVDGMYGGGCFWLGTLYKPFGCPPGRTCLQFGGYGEPRDARVAAGWFEKACAGGQERACKEVLVMMHEGTYAPRAAEYAAVVDALVEGCADARDDAADACHTLLDVADWRAFTPEEKPHLADQLHALCKKGRKALCGREKDLLDGS